MNYLVIILLLLVAVLSYNYSKLRKNKINLFDKTIKNLIKTETDLRFSIKEKRGEIEILSNAAARQTEELRQEHERVKDILMDAMYESIERYRTALFDNANQQARKNEEKLRHNYEVRASDYETKLEELSTEVDKEEVKLNELRRARELINQDILRQRALEEQRDFYRIIIPTDSYIDISMLQSIRQSLNKRENLDKMIYDNYIAKPTLEMIKRVLGGKAPSGIYKITRLKTGEIYIGRSTDVKTRWQQHVKTVFNCGTIARSILHQTIQKDGIENFTFELIEECSKDNLGEREKFWIDFYGSKQYGLNEKAGG